MSRIEVDLGAYFARVGYQGPCEPTLGVLRDLHRLHPAAIPFEAIDVLLGREIALDPATLQAKMIAGGRGGYCFEQNYLLRHVLRAIGFQVDGLIARSLLGRPLEDVRPRTHMALRVRLQDEDWLADVGFSAVTLTAPIRLASFAPQDTLFEPVRLRPIGAELRYEVLIGDEWRPVYDLVPAPQLDIDLQMSNWFVSTHPNSPFRQALVVSRTTPQVRHLLNHNRLTVRRPGHEPERRRLSAEEVETCLVRDFGLCAQPSWRPVIERAVVAGDEAERRG
jgi:N-hydroxyarylamine O-acetyltransferase